MKIASIVRAFDAFDAVIIGEESLAVCARRLQISQTRCHQLTKTAHNILAHPSCAAADEPASDRDDLPRVLRMALAREHKDFWRRRLSAARALLQPCADHQLQACSICAVRPSIYFIQARAAGARVAN